MSPPEEPRQRFRLRERFVWLWHPHFWLIFALVVILLVLAMRLAG